MFRFSVRPNQAYLVKWRQWGDEAFQEAREQDKPIVLFLVAFWCGVCQRMDETSLSNEEAIALLNAFFVPIRVEESQRPDVDLRYNQNGWPTIAFLTPNGDHLFSVNSMAPEPFIDLLVRIVEHHRRGEIAVQEPAPRTDVGRHRDSGDQDLAPLGAPMVAEIAGMIEGLADPVHGGYGANVKFLHPEANDFFLYLYEVTGEKTYLDHVLLTLDKMRLSPTFDAGDGGFYRYSTRQDWREPHPEKLLDDQAALMRNYLRAYLLTEDPSLREAAEGLIDYLNVTLWDGARGAFFGCQDYVRPTRDMTAGRPSGPPPRISVIDQCIYCDANARTASAYLEAWWILGRAEYRERARAVIELLWSTMRVPNRGMYHYSEGGEAHVPGILNDAVFTGTALLDAYAYLHDPIDLDRAKQLADDILSNHGNPAGGFSDISQTGPARLQFPVTVLTQNAAVAAFLVRLADLSGDVKYRPPAYWALQSSPNGHRKYEAFAAGYGQALSRLLTPPLLVTVSGTPGDPGVRALARAALTQLRRQDLVLCFQEGHYAHEARVSIHGSGRSMDSITDPEALRPELLEALSRE